MNRNIPIFMIACTLSVAGCKQISQLPETFEDVSLTGIFNQSPDHKLVQAFIDSDTQTIEEIMNSGEKGEIVDRIKSYEPELKIRSYPDLQKAMCLSQFLCDENTMNNFMETCIKESSRPMNGELQAYPGCEKEIREFYTVTSLCKLGPSVCPKEDTNLLLTNPKKRNEDLIKNGQKLYDCMNTYMSNMNARTDCITQTPRYSNTELDKQINIYCKQATECHVFNDVTQCTEKYQSMLKNDKHAYQDCTNQHITYKMLEFQLLDFTFKTAQENGQNLCPFMADYENSVHPEEIFDNSKSIDEYNQKTLEITQERRISWLKLATYMTPQLLEKVDSNEYQEMLVNHRTALTYYSACRISHYGVK